MRLRVENKGQILHEIVLGTRATLEEHVQAMFKFPKRSLAVTGAQGSWIGVEACMPMRLC